MLSSLAGAMHTRPALPRSPRACVIRASLFDENRLNERQERFARVAKLYTLDPETDGVEIANLAASSLPEEENGTWADVAICSLRNVCAVAAVLAVVGAIPSQASAATPPAVLVADAETLDIVASLAVPLLIGGGLVAFAAANYENFIDKLNDGR